MKLLQKVWPVGLAMVLSILPIAAFADTGFLGSIPSPLMGVSHLFLLLGLGMWIFLQDSKCCHSLILFTLLVAVLGVFLGGILPVSILGVSVVALLLVLMGVVIVTQLKIHHIAGIVLSIVIGFFITSGIGGIALTATAVLGVIGMLIGVFLGVASGFGTHALLKDVLKGKLIMLIGIMIGLVGLLKLFAIM